MEALAELIDESIGRISMGNSLGSMRVPPGHFSKCFPLNLTDEFWNGEDDFLMPADADPTVLDRPLDAAFVGTYSHSPFQFTRVQKTRWRDVPTEVSPRLINLDVYKYATLWANRNTTTATSYAVWDTKKNEFRPLLFINRFQQWNDGDLRPNEGLGARAEGLGINEMFYRLACGFAMAARYVWFVRFKTVKNGIGIAIPTDPVGVRALLADRNKPTQGRRKAIIHWVDEHARRKRSDSSDTAWVRAHMRGHEQFVWHNMECTIFPSEFDVDKVRKLDFKDRTALSEARP